MASCSKLLSTSLLGLFLSFPLAVATAQDKPSPSSHDPGPEVSASEEPVKVNTRTSDSEIQAALERILSEFEEIENFRVRVQFGVVAISGTTKDPSQKKVATEIARNTEGVAAVINDIEVEGSGLHWSQALSHLLYLAAAFALALPIAWNREGEARSAGLRTFPLVSVASCGYMLIALHALGAADAQARVMYGIITGIGFIGGGAILKNKEGVHGTATAASIWNTAAIGVAVAWSHFEIAIVLCGMNFATLHFVGGLKSRMAGAEPLEAASQPSSQVDTAATESEPKI